MVRWVVGSILHGVDPLSYFSLQPVLHDWCNKGRGMCYPVCGMVHIKEPLLLIVRMTHTTAFVTPVMEHWLEREIAQWVHQEGSIRRPSHHERTLLPRSYISLRKFTNGCPFENMNKSRKANLFVFSLYVIQ